MTIDPVVLLAEDLRSTEAALDKATQIYAKDQYREDGELVALLLERSRRVHCELFETVPTSALGAAELVRLSAERLLLSYSDYAAHLHKMADRLSAGQRHHFDLIWLRALQAALMEGLCGEDGGKVVPLLNLAIIGAARPVTVFRAVQPTSGNVAWKAVLETRFN